METKVISNDIMFAEVARLISEGRSVEIRVKGNSMNPFLASGRDCIVLSPFIDKDLVPGAFVLGRDTYGRWVAHRLVSVASDHVIMNGDGNFITSTEKMMKTDVLAVVTEYVRDGKRGSTSGRRWKTYSFLWKLAGQIHVGKWSVRRVYLGFWRRLNRSLVIPTGRI